MMGDLVDFRRKPPVAPALQFFIVEETGFERPEPNKPPANWSEVCDQLGTAGGVTVNSEAARLLWWCLAFYILRAPNEGSWPSRSEVRRRLERVSSAAKRLQSVLEEVHRENPVGTETLIYRKLTVDIEMDRLLPTLAALAAASCAAADDIPGHFRTRASSGGRPPFPAFDDLVEELATIYHFLGGNVSSAQSADGVINGPFVRFCRASFETVESLLPAGTPRPTNTFGDAVRNSLKRVEESGWGGAGAQQIAHILSEPAGDV